MGLLFALLLLACVQTLNGSSHSEAPGTASGPKSDLTDFYMFTSYEPGHSNFVTLIANINGLQETQSGPNYSPIASDFVYNIHIENSGDGIEDITFQFIAGARYSGSQDPAKGTGEGLRLGVPRRNPIKNVKVALSHIGTVGVGSEGSLNYKEHYALRVFAGASGKSSNVDNGPFATSTVGNNTEFRIPYSYAGNKTFADYDAYARSFITDINIPGCGVPGKVFVGQRQEPFGIALGATFDLINYNPTTGGESDSKNSLIRKAVTSFAIEVDKSCLVGNGNGVIGGWASVQHLGHVGATHAHVAGAQKNRLGNPLVNELFIGLTDKDSWNSNHPRNDVQYRDYLDYPTFPEIVDILFGNGDAQPSIAPTFYPRVDITTVLYQGVPLLANNYTTQQIFVSPTQCGTITTPPLADMLRLNTNFPPTALVNQSNIGILAVDIAGFPNGRRPGDDVVDIFLRVGMGVLCHPPFTTLLGICNSTQAPIGNVALTDHAPVNAAQFDNAFPYLRSPSPGNQDRCP